MADISSVKLPDASEYDVTDAEALHSSDPVNNLNSTSTSLPLAANMGHAIGNNLAAIEESGAKNLNSYPYYGNKVENGITWTVNSDGSVTVSGIATATAYIELHNRLPETPNTCILKAGTYILTGGVSSKVTINIDQRDSGGSYTPIGTDSGSGLTFTIVSDVEFPNAARIGLTLVVDSGTDLSTPVTIYPMVRDARVNDSTFMPYAKTNVQLTNDKAERKDLTTIFATGTTNNTGVQINAGAFFYLNGVYCKAKTNIAANAAFTLNTNYKETNTNKILTGETWEQLISSLTGETIYAKRIGDICTINMNGSGVSITGESWVTLATVPDDMIPSREQRINIIVGYSGTLGWARITTTGALQLYLLSAVSNDFFIETIIYIR